jgi:hypothetical protein
MKGMITGFKWYDVLSDQLGVYHNDSFTGLRTPSLPKSAWPRVSARTILAVLVIHNPLTDLFTSLRLRWHAIRIRISRPGIQPNPAQLFHARDNREVHQKDESVQQSHSQCALPLLHPDGLLLTSLQTSLFTATASFAMHFSTISHPIAGEYDLLGKHPDAAQTIRNVGRLLAVQGGPPGHSCTRDHSSASFNHSEFNSYFFDRLLDYFSYFSRAHLNEKICSFSTCMHLRACDTFRATCHKLPKLFRPFSSKLNL